MDFCLQLAIEPGGHLKTQHNLLLHIACLGGVVTGLTATQRSLTTVGGESEIEITWTPPSPAPQDGYQTAIGTAPLLTISAPPHVRIVSEVGVLTVTLRTLSQHYIPTVQATVTVLGE